MTNKLLNYNFAKKDIKCWKTLHNQILQGMSKGKAQLFQNNLCWLYVSVKEADTIYVDEFLQLCYKVSVRRQNTEKIDNLNIVTCRNFGGKRLTENTNIEIIGHLSSKNVIDQEGKNHVKVFVYDREHKIIEENLENKLSSTNFVYLDGYVCKEPIYRKTLFDREITVLLVAVNRTKHGRTDYIPCITWYSNAHKAIQLKVGDRIKLYGFAQSRKYGEGQHETYEVSVQHFFKVE